MGDVENLNNTLHKTKHVKSSIPRYRVKLDPVAISNFVGWIERTSNISGYITSNSTTHHKKEPQTKL